MILITTITCIFLGLFLLIIGFIHANLLQVAIFCCIIAFLWLISQWRNWAWAISLCFFLNVCVAGLGVWIGLSPILMGISVFAYLFAWDLANFSVRMRSAAPDDGIRRLSRDHLSWLVSIGFLGLVLTLPALLFHMHISFGWMLLLALASVIGLAQFVNRLRRGGL